MEKKEFVRAAYAATVIEAEQMVDILQQNGILARRQGGIKDIYMGGSAMGEEIVVPAEDLEQAIEILQNFRPIQTTAPQREKAEETEKKPGVRRILSWIAGAAVLLLLMVLLGFVSGSVGR